MNQQTKSSPVEEPSTTAVLDTNGTTHPTNDEIHSADSADTRSRVILNAMVAFRDGNFSVRLPADWAGIDGRIAEAFNQTIDHEDRMFREVKRLSVTVGKEGRLKQRMSLAGAVGDWAVKGRSHQHADRRPGASDRGRGAHDRRRGQGRSWPVHGTGGGRPALKGEFLRSAKLVNTMIEQLSVFTSEVTRVAREVGTEGKLGGQAQVKGVSGVWKDLTESVNQMAGNLTAQVRNIADVTIAVANGDLSKKITVDVRGEILQLKEAINTMVDQLRSFASEVTRVAREVGTDGRLGGQAVVPGAGGTWKDLTDSVNAMASNLTAQVRNIAAVTTAVARGDLSRKITVDVKGEILELKETINTMVDQLNGFSSEVTRVAREVGTEGKLGGQAAVPGVAGTWKDLTDSVNSMASNLTAQVRNIAEVTTAVAEGDLSRKITVDVKGEILALKNTVNVMVDQLNAFAGEVTRVAREVGTEGKLGGQAAGARRGWHLEGPHRQRELHGLEPHRPGPQHRGSHHGRCQRRPFQEDHGRRARRNSRAEEHDQHDGRSAQRLCVRSDARRARGRHRRRAGRSGRGARRGRHLEGSDRLRQCDGDEPHVAGAQYRRSDDGRRERRLVQEDHRRRCAAKFSSSRTRSTRWSISSTPLPAKSAAWRARSAPKGHSAARRRCPAWPAPGRT